TAAPAALRIYVLDVGGDDAVLVRTPAGRTILIDGGSDPTALLTQLGQRLGLLDRNLTVAILTRADAAHVPGLTAAAGRFPPALVVLPPEGSNSAAYTQLLGIASQTKTLTADSGMTIEIEPGVSLELTPTRPLPGPANDATPPLRSLAVRIVDRGVTVLVAPGLTAPGIHDLAAGGWPLRADAWLMPYHGDRVALDSEALANIDPTVAIIAVGPRDRANHPAPAVLDLLRDRQLFRTDLQGTITIETDGSRLEISTERIAPGRT
ncbi:MAG: competence protein ComEC, partial [Chloroflexota bacterium]|nr:competence protein ComEC [Chloroflexota bacterium]